MDTQIHEIRIVIQKKTHKNTNNSFELSSPIQLPLHRNCLYGVDHGVHLAVKRHMLAKIVGGQLVVYLMRGLSE